MKRERAGLFLAEVMVAAGLLAAAISALMQVCGAGLAGTNRTVDSSDAVRSALIAIEALKGDTKRMVVQDPSDLSITGNGTGLRLLVPARKPESDLWEYDGVAVQWSLQPVSGTTERLYTLVRTAGGSSRALPGCYLRDLKVREHKAGTLGRGNFLDITVTAVGAPGSPTAVSLSFLAPIRMEGEL